MSWDLGRRLVVRRQHDGFWGMPREKRRRGSWSSFRWAITAPPNTPQNPSSRVHPRAHEVTNAITVRSIPDVAYLTLAPLWHKTSILCIRTCTIRDRTLPRETFLRTCLSVLGLSSTPIEGSTGLPGGSYSHERLEALQIPSCHELDLRNHSDYDVCIYPR